MDYCGRSEVIRRRGFKPSDRFDPQKQEVLQSLTHKILHMEERSGVPRDWRTRKILSCQSDFHPELFESRLLPKRKVFGSSDYFGPFDPSIDEQKSKAREISSSITDVENSTSKGQSMFYKRKKKSVKWEHQGPTTHEFQRDEEESTQQDGSMDNYYDYSTTSLSHPMMYQPSSSIEKQINFWENNHNNNSNPHHIMMTQDYGGHGGMYSNRNYNTAPRGYAHGQTIYHTIYLS